MIRKSNGSKMLACMHTLNVRQANAMGLPIHLLLPSVKPPFTGNIPISEQYYAIAYTVAMLPSEPLTVRNQDRRVIIPFLSRYVTYVDA